MTTPPTFGRRLMKCACRVVGRSVVVGGGCFTWSIGVLFFFLTSILWVQSLSLFLAFPRPRSFVFSSGCFWRRPPTRPPAMAVVPPRRADRSWSGRPAVGTALKVTSRTTVLAFGESRHGVPEACSHRCRWVFRARGRGWRVDAHYRHDARAEKGRQGGGVGDESDASFLSFTFLSRTARSMRSPWPTCERWSTSWWCRTTTRCGRRG